jgi:hypothetical protein
MNTLVNSKSFDTFASDCYLYIHLGQVIKRALFNKIKGTPIMVVVRKQPTTSYARRIGDSHTYGGRTCFITILKNMTGKKNLQTFGASNHLSKKGGKK